MINSFEKDPGKGSHCGRVPCPPCDSSEKRQNCRSRNLVYESKCKVCNPTSQEESGHQSAGNKPRMGIYIGETSRSLHERALEHIKDAEGFCPKSHIVKHWMTSHPELDAPPQMEFGITAMFRDCLSRQIGEALRISYSKDNILNSKGEYLGNVISRLTIEEDAWERKERNRNEEEQERLDKLRVEQFKKSKQSIWREEEVSNHQEGNSYHEETTDKLETTQSPKTINASGPTQEAGINMPTCSNLSKYDKLTSSSQGDMYPPCSDKQGESNYEGSHMQHGINMPTSPIREKYDKVTSYRDSESNQLLPSSDKLESEGIPRGLDSAGGINMPTGLISRKDRKKKKFKHSYTIILLQPGILYTLVE